MIVVEHAYRGRVRRVEIDASCAVVGRAHGKRMVDVDLAPDEAISRLHAVISFRDGSLWIEDLGSRSGTLVDRQDVTNRGASPLAPEATVLMGETTLGASLARTPTSHGVLITHTPSAREPAHSLADELARRERLCHVLGTDHRGFWDAAGPLERAHRDTLWIVADAFDREPPSGALDAPDQSPCAEHMTRVVSLRGARMAPWLRRRSPSVLEWDGAARDSDIRRILGDLATAPSTAPESDAPRLSGSTAELLVASPVRKPADDAHPVADASLIGQAIGGCQIERLIGAGGMGVVYAGKQASLDRDVAIKVLACSKDTRWERLERFKREAMLAARFESPHVVRVYDAGQTGRLLYLVMELVRGLDASRWIAEQPDGRLQAPDAIRFLGQVVGVFVEAERLGVIHRDMKPSNLLVRDRATIKVGDFGLAKAVHAEADPSVSLTAPRAVLGTAPYMSPEQLRSESLDSRSDMHAVGTTFYELLTGVRPFTSGSALDILKLKSDAPLVPHVVGGQPQEREALARCIERMTRPSPGDRFESFAELGEAIAEWA